MQLYFVIISVLAATGIQALPVENKRKLSDMYSEFGTQLIAHRGAIDGDANYFMAAEGKR